MLSLFVYLQSAWLSRTSGRDERGQATAEYALVLLGVAALALLVAAWASRTNLIGRLLDAVLGRIISRFT